MNAAETIEAAIQNLERKRADADDLTIPLVSGLGLTRADLFATLHRTVDAQLAILRSASSHFTEISVKKFPGTLSARFSNELDLARAILGESS